MDCRESLNLVTSAKDIIKNIIQNLNALLSRFETVIKGNRTPFISDRPQIYLPESNFYTGLLTWPGGGGAGAGKYQIYHGIGHMLIYPSKRSCRLPSSGKGQVDYPLLVTPGGDYQRPVQTCPFGEHPE